MGAEVLPGSSSSTGRPHWLLLAVFAAVAFLLGLLLWQCGSAVTTGTKHADQAVNQFHAQFNAGQYEQIYSQAAPEFQQSASKDEIIALFQHLHERLGDAQSTTRTGWNATATTGGSFVTVVYDTKFSSGDGVETFRWHSTGGKMLLVNYNVNSRALLLK